MSLDGTTAVTREYAGPVADLVGATRKIRILANIKHANINMNVRKIGDVEESVPPKSTGV